MKNLCIVYNSREGSTAVLDSLSRHSSIIVPVVEHMDRRNIEKTFGNKYVSDICIAIHNLIVGGGYDKDIFDPNRSIKNDLSESVVFKWRPFGNISNLGDVFRKTNTSVFCLARRDLVSLGLSKYYNNRVLAKESEKQNHPQFQVKKMTQGEREKYLSKIRSCDFEVDVSDFLKDIQEYVEEKKILFSKACGMRERGVDVYYDYYESFLFDKHAFLKKLVDIVDLEFECDVLNTGYVKVNSSDMRSQVSNIDEVESDPDVLSLKNDYENLCNRFFPPLSD